MDTNREKITGSNIVKSGELYDFVERVNYELMEAEGQGKL
jgi:hypothetical protein